MLAELREGVFCRVVASLRACLQIPITASGGLSGCAGSRTPRCFHCVIFLKQARDVGMASGLSSSKGIAKMSSLKIRIYTVIQEQLHNRLMAIARCSLQGSALSSSLKIRICTMIQE